MKYEKEAAPVQRVLILSGHSFFGQCVESLLQRQAGLEVVGREADIDSAIARIQELRPDAVIVDGECPGDGCAAMLRILTEATAARVITVSRQDNTLCVYYGEQRVVRDTDDLLAAIAHQPLPGSSTAVP